MSQGLPARAGLADRRQRDMRSPDDPVCQAAMTHVSLYDRARARLVGGWRDRAVIFKAISFAMIGVVNSAVDYGVFLIARSLLDRSATAAALFASVSGACECGSPAAISLIAANALSWIVAATGSYVMNSTITFAAESGRKLRWGSYFAFLASGFAGWIANTAMLLLAAEVLLLPVWLAKLVAILASFMVNFLLSHFVVFRVRSNAKVEAKPEA
jgi:putative flippase GtrA